MREFRLDMDRSNWTVRYRWFILAGGEKQREKRWLTAAKNVGDMAVKWLAEARLADSTRAMRKHIVDRDILPAFQNQLLTETTADDLRALCHIVKARGASATAVQIRDIVKQVYAFAILHGERMVNPAVGRADCLDCDLRA